MVGWGPDAMMGWGWGWGWMGVVGMLSMVLFWAVLILGLVWLVRAFQRTGEAPGAPRAPEVPTALRILEERLARGEIDIEEFNARRSAIQSAPR